MTVYFEYDRWIEVGWLKSTSPYETKTVFYVGWKTGDDFQQELFGNAQYNTSHNYKIYKAGNYWKVYIDGSLKKFLAAAWQEGDIMAQSESQDSASPPVNELEGYHSDLRYYTGSSWIWWDDMYPSSDAPYYCLCEISSHEFTTSGAFPEWSLDWTDECIVTKEEALEVVMCYFSGEPHNGHVVSKCDALWLVNCYMSQCMRQYPC